MNFKNKLNQIKALLSMEVKLAQQTLMDGVTTIEAEEFAPDYSVGIVTPDGVVPLPVGEYTMQDGNVLVVEQEGIIMSITPANEEEAMPEADHPTAEATEVQAEATPKKVVESVSKETFFNSQLEEIGKQVEALKAENERLKTELASNEPAVKPITHNPEAKEKSLYKMASNAVPTTNHRIFNNLFSNKN